MPKILRTSSRCTTSTSGKGSVKYVNWSPWCITLSSSVPLWNASNVSVSPSPFVSGNYEEQIVYLDPIATALQKGDRVRVTGGIFEGVEGAIIRVKGDRRVSVCIQGVMAVATAYIHPSLIERIPDSSL